MGEMSSIVSRRPDAASDLASAGSPMNHRKEAFWISIRLGTSSTFSSLEKVRRLLGAWVLAGKASPPEGLVEKNQRAWNRTNGATTKGISTTGSPQTRTRSPPPAGNSHPEFHLRRRASPANYTAPAGQVKQVRGHRHKSAQGDAAMVAA